MDLSYIQSKFKTTFKPIVEAMIDNGLGAMPCSVIIPPTSDYNPMTGEQSTADSTSDNIKASIYPTTKDDYDYLPEGFREKDVRKILSNIILTRDMTITSTVEDLEFEVIRPSIPMTATNNIFCYRTYVARVENQDRATTTTTATTTTIIED